MDLKSYVDKKETSSEFNADVSKGEINFFNEQEKDEVSSFKKSRGVLLIESVKDLIKEDRNKNLAKWILMFSILIFCWSVNLDRSTTKNYEVPVTSMFDNHTLIATIAIATKIISAIGQLFFAKFSDVISRPATFIAALLFYVIGIIIIPTSSNLSSYIVGTVFYNLGRSVLSLTNAILVGDLTPLQWRCFSIAALSAPSFINTWYAGPIVDKILASNWKWGYGMFAIMIPVCLTPGVLSLFYYQRKAEKLGIVQEKSQKYGINVHHDASGRVQTFIATVKEVDILGLILLATSLTLILLPLSLYETANNHWKNPSLISMFVVGGVLLFGFISFEVYIAPYPCLHKSNFNRTVLTETVFNIFYFMASAMRETYLSSFVWVYKNWSNRDWTYFNNADVVSKSFFGLGVGLLHRYTHRYKYLQIIGIAIEIIAAGVWVSVTGEKSSTGKMVILQILLGLGGSMSVYSSRTVIQAAVPHQNMAVAYSILMLFSSIGSSIGSAVSGAIWNSKMPKNLRKHMPDNVSDQQVMSFFKNLKMLRKFPMDSPVRKSAIKAYTDTMHYIFVPSLSILFISFVVCFAQRNFYLGKGQNAVEELEHNEPDNEGKVSKFFETFGMREFFRKIKS